MNTTAAHIGQIVAYILAAEVADARKAAALGALYEGREATALLILEG